MKDVVKPRQYRKYLVTVGYLLLGIFIFWVVMLWSATDLDHPHPGAVVVKAPKTTAAKQLSAQGVSVIPSPNLSTNLKPDYSIPGAIDGMAPVIYRMATNEKIVFLTIDDGAYKGQSVLDNMKKYHIQASLFLTRVSISDNPDFFKQLTAMGSVIEDHTLNHDTNMTKDMTYAQQKAEICGMADYEQVHYGRRPTLFRPPGGAYSDSLRQAAAACGMKAVVTWIAKANGGAMQYQVGSKLRPGDIVLMHFRPVFAADMKAFVDAATAAGLHTALLENAL